MEKEKKLSNLKNYLEKTFEVEFKCLEDVEEFMTEDFDTKFNN